MNRIAIYDEEFIVMLDDLLPGQCEDFAFDLWPVWYDDGDGLVTIDTILLYSSTNLKLSGKN